MRDIIKSAPDKLIDISHVEASKIIFITLWYFIEANTTSENFKVRFREINLIPFNRVNPVLQVGILTFIPKSKACVGNVVCKIPKVFVAWDSNTCVELFVFGVGWHWGWIQNIGNGVIILGIDGNSELNRKSGKFLVHNKIIKRLC